MPRERAWHIRTKRPEPVMEQPLSWRFGALVIEDDRSVAALLTKLLTSANFECEAAADLATASERLRSRSFDLIVLDLKLPDRPGDALVRMLREAGDETPILVVTGVLDPGRQASLLDAGADAYLVKPFEAEVFDATVRALMRRPRSMRRMIRFDGDLLLDPVRRVIVWRGCVQHVPPTAFGLLWLLGANAGAPFSTEKVCVELEGSCTPASVRRVWEHMEETIAFVRDFSGGELQVASERGKGYALRRGNIVPVD